MSQTTPGNVFDRIRPLFPQLADNIPDAELLRRFAEGRHEAAFAALVQRHGPMVLGVCRRLLHHQQDAEDAWQAVFLTLVRKAASLRKREALGAWLHRVAVRTAGRQRKDTERYATVAVPPVTAAQVDPLALVSGRELLGLLDEELARLPEKYRTPLVLCYLEGHTQEEAAAQLGCPRSTLKGRLERGRRLLHRRLSRRGVTLPATLLLTALAPPAPAVSAVLTAATVRSALATVAAPPSGGTFAVPGNAKVALVLLLGLGVLTAALGGSREAPKSERPLPVKPTRQPKTAAQRPPRRDRYGDPLPPGALARLGTVRFRCEGRAKDLAFSPDGRLLAALDETKVLLWDARTGRELRRLGIRGPIGKLAFTPDGKTLVVRDGSRELRVWDVSSGKVRRTLPLPPAWEFPGGLTRLCFSPDGSYFALHSGDGNKVDLIDVASGKSLHQLGGQKCYIYGLAFSPDGKTLALGTLGPSVQLWDARSGKLLRGIDSHGPRFVHAVAFSRDGKRLASVDDNRIILSDVASGKELSRFEIPVDVAIGLEFSRDGKLLLAGSQDGKVCIWDLARHKLRSVFDARLGRGHALALTPDGKTLALAADTGVRLWEVAADKELFTDFHGLDGVVNDMAFFPDGKTLVTGGDNQQVRLWDTATWQQTKRLKVSADTLAVATEGRRLVTRTMKTTVRVWNLLGGSEATKISIPDADWVTGAALLFGGRQLLTLDQKWDRRHKTTGVSRLALWDAATGHLRRRFTLPNPWAERLALTPDERTAVVDYRGKLRLIDLESGKQRLELAACKMPVKLAAEKMPGGSLAVALPVASLAVAPDGETLLTGRCDGCLTLWELATGRVVLQLPRHNRSVAAVAFGTGGRLLASAEGNPGLMITTFRDGISLFDTATREKPPAIHLWDAATGEEVERFQGLTAHVTSLAFAPDGTQLVSGHRDGTVLVWNVKPALRKLTTRWQKPTRAELVRLWDDLAAEPAKGQRALWRLASFPGSVAFLKDRLRPTPVPSPARIRQLLAGLGDDRFTTRQKATHELEGLGEQAVPALRGILDGGPTLEVRRRVEALLASAAVVRSPETLRVLRAIRALEHVGSQEARDVLTLLSKGDPAARTTREAKAALGRSLRSTSPANEAR